MKVVGIIAEFNPMHTGHKYLVEEAKRITGADVAICIMSGNFTQAGNIAIANKFERAKIAVENGFDVVIELPVIYATASAQYFAKGAIEILNSLNCVDYLVFGSETANTEELEVISRTLCINEEEIWKSTTEFFKSGISFAKAREQAISEFLTDRQLDVAIKPNNILGIEYLKNLFLLRSKIQPIAVKRLENDLVISATQIRELLQEKKLNEANKYMLEIIQDSSSIVYNDSILELIKYNIVNSSTDKLSNINEVTEGLENTLIKKVSSADSYMDFIQEIKSKRYQLSKIKRILINILLNITKEDFSNLSNAHYAHILCVKQENKKEILSHISSNASIPVLTSLNDNVINILDDENSKSLKLDIKASNIYSIISNDKINKDYTNRI